MSEATNVPEMNTPEDLPLSVQEETPPEVNETGRLQLSPAAAALAEAMLKRHEERIARNREIDLSSLRAKARVGLKRRAGAMSVERTCRRHVI